MNRRELAERINQFEASCKKWDIPLITAYIIGLLLMAWMFARFDDGSGLFDLLAVIGLLVYIIGSFPLAFRFYSKKVDEHGLRCPECSAALTGSVGRAVVTSLHCSQCGSKIIDGLDGEQNAGDRRPSL
jgi:DNA-directed RNA polymerase subunit RPC12/RpoP